MRFRILAALCLSVAFAQTVYKATPTDLEQVTAKTAELGQLVAQLKAKNADATLLADVAVFHKAGQMLLEFPDEFFVAADVPNAVAVLEKGIVRARQLLAGQSPWTHETPRRLHAYVSPLDGSVQPYALRIPANYDPSKPTRLYVWLHGRDQRNTEAAFLTKYTNTAPNHSTPADEGQLQLDVYGRWNGIAFHWAGEADVIEALAAVQKRYKIDPERIILRGFSMGGCGAWHIALHHPGAFAAAEIGAGTWPSRSQMPGFPDYQAGPLRIYENIIDWSLNVFNLPLAGHDGDSETGVSSIPPPPPGTKTRGQLESSLRVRAQLEREGYPSEGDEYNLRVPGTAARFLISKETGHSTSPEVRAHLNAFLKEHGDRGRVSPDRIRFVTYTTRYPTSHWVTFEHLGQHYERAEIDAKRSGGIYSIKTKNLTRFTLRETTAAKTVEIDGQSLPVKPAATLRFAKTGETWRLVGPTTAFHKSPKLQGPIDDAFMDPFLLVRPTGQPWNQAAHDQSLRLLARFDRLYAKGLRAHPRVKDDKDVTSEDLLNYNLILFGDPGSNSWIAKLQSKVPYRWTKTELALSDQTYSSATHLPAMIYPNPLSPQHYVVINSGMTIDDREYRGEYAMPRLGDYAILKVTPDADWPEVATAGLFNEEWKLKGPQTGPSLLKKANP